TPTLTNEQFQELQTRIQNTNIDIKLEILKHLSADQWDSTINRMLSTDNPSTADLDQLHLVTSYKGQDVLRKTDRERPVLAEAIRKNKPILYNWFLKIAGDDTRRKKLLNQTTPWGQTVLQTAILNDRFQTAKELMAAGATPSLDDAHLAASHGKRAFLERTLLPALDMGKPRGFILEDPELEGPAENLEKQPRHEALMTLAARQQTDIQNHQQALQHRRNESLLNWAKVGNHPAEHLVGLIRAGAQVNTLDSTHKTPLHYAVATGRGWLVEPLLLHGANINIKTKNGNTVVHYAIAQRDIELLRLLLRYQPDLKLKHGAYPENSYLQTALETGDNEIAKMIISHQPELIIQPNRHDQYPLKEAIRAGNEEIVEAMVAHYPDILYAQERDGSRPQHWAASTGNVNMLALLFPKDIPVSQLRDGLGNSLLHLAAVRGQTDMVNFLIPQEKENLARPNHYHRTPLFEAVSSGNLDTVKAILKHHPTDTLQFSCDGYVPLHIALRKQEHRGIVKALLAHDPESIQVRNKRKQNLLHLLPEYPHHAKLLETLTRQCPEMLEEADSDGMTPLHYAVENQNLHAIRTFLATSPKLANQPTSRGELPIHRALVNYKEGLITELLKGGDKQSINVPNPTGEPPLYYAVKHYPRPTAMLKELLESGADINLADT
ncbi:MAG TPA: ankyrin repeat domain-containing protein, partial [Nitrospira sp.]|nr:ankyrin repeat domain-containing protein [Nitrospira sp.]